MEKSNKKWFVVFGAVLLQVCLGAIYSLSLFNQPLMDYIKAPVQNIVTVETSQSKAV